ncbi:MAG: hypothetical protein RBT39_09760 [Azoarcus sp.]|nr:hypothetical protein [Azoarcus sp.]MDD2873315.1 hypothetical protein [Azoarcus sp.]MDX9837835.1 hypothetical protein [Azoarcus sp.]
MAAIKADPSKVVFGAGGSVGSQEWMKSALVAKAAGTMRTVGTRLPARRNKALMRASSAERSKGLGR